MELHAYLLKLFFKNLNLKKKIDNENGSALCLPLSH